MFVKRIVALLLVAGPAVFTSLYAATPQEIVAGWAGISGGKNGKVVYGWNNQIWVLDLTTGNAAAIANWNPGTTAYGMSCCYRWSGDGKRIMVQNPTGVSVLNADGTAMKTIASPQQCSDLIWGDWDGNAKIVYSAGPTVVRQTINADNTAGAIEVLVNEAPVRCWSSVSIDGNYLAYNNIEGNAATGGYHQPRMKTLPNGPTVRLVADNGDGCQLAVMNGHGGQVTFMEFSHTQPSTVANSTGQVVAHIAQASGCGTGGTALCPQRAHCWSNDADYFMNQGDGSTFTWAWVRKFSTWGGFIVSTSMYYPDLYVSAATTTLPLKNRDIAGRAAPVKDRGLYSINGRRCAWFGQAGAGICLRKGADTRIQINPDVK